MRVPEPTAAELADGRAFAAMMEALARPGRLVAATTDMAALAAALLDLEVSHATPCVRLAAAVAPTGSRRVAPEEADYLFYPELSADDLADLGSVRCGDPLYPDTGATLFVGAELGTGPALRLAGPGIAGEATLHVGGLPSGLWALRDRTVAYPLGWDLMLVGDGRLVGLPRSTRIEVP